jgi:hypothetical protein
MLVAALWTARNDATIAARFKPPNLTVAAQAVRYAAMSLAAFGELVLVMLVIGKMWRRDWLTNVLALSATLIFLLSTAGAVALALAGR